MKALEKKLDDVFSEYIRLRDKGKPCCTCQKPRYLQCGHYMSRIHKATRWDEKNAHGQCIECNMTKNGMPMAYAKFMIEKYGKEVHDEIVAKAHRFSKMSTFDLGVKIAEYRALIKKLKESNFKKYESK